MGEDVSDEELAAVARRIREHRRQSRLAMLAAVGVAMVVWLAGSIAGGVLVGVNRVFGQVVWGSLLLGGVVGAALWKRLTPKSDPYYDDE